MEIVKNADGVETMAIKVKVSISHTAIFEDAIIYISIDEFTQCLESVLNIKITDRKSNPFIKNINPPKEPDQYSIK